MLNSVTFNSVYASGESEPSEFFIEALINSNTLDLGLGYFSSSGFRALAIGFAFFIKRGGKMRIIINDVLSGEDKEAILSGFGQKETGSIEDVIIQDIKNLKNTLSRKDKHFFKCLSWLIATERLDIKAAIPKKNKVGIVHQKFGIFKDEAENSIAFTGSVNFSANAIYNNVEAIWCDYSWDGSSRSSERITYFENIFQKTWTGASEVMELISIEQVRTVIKDEFSVNGIKELIDEEIELAKEESLQSLPKELSEKINKLIKELEPPTLLIKSTPTLPELRPYQEEAIHNWKANGYRGMLEMATGTGKTFTALAAAWELIREKERLFIIISCPFIHLAEQWQEEALKFGLESILVGDSRQLWEADAARQAQLFKRNKIDRVVLVTTNASFASDTFQKIIRPCIKETLLIIDEAHYAGATSIRKLLPTDCPYRLGLSATPERHGDAEGSQALLDYFGSIVFSFPIEQAIGVFLTPYYYHPIPVELTEQEFAEYCDLSIKIAKLAGKDDEKSRSILEMLAIERARVQNNSINKLHWIRENVREESITFSLFYAGDQIFDNVKRIIGKELKFRVHEFTSRQSRSERKQLLKDFAEQKIQSLVAMKCLDEGVDVPPTRVAYFLASSSNPREFIQRRGRVLRKSEGKDHAIIYDLISIPPKRFIEQGRAGKNFFAVKSAFTKEYKRVQEFANMAKNKYTSIQELYTMADQLDLLDLTID